jgi:hypothetical protein
MLGLGLWKSAVQPRVALPALTISTNLALRSEGGTKPVHEWTGFYDLFNWGPVRIVPAREEGAKP